MILKIFYTAVACCEVVSRLWGRARPLAILCSLGINLLRLLCFRSRVETKLSQQAVIPLSPAQESASALTNGHPGDVSI